MNYEGVFFSSLGYITFAHFMHRLRILTFILKMRNVLARRPIIQMPAFINPLNYLKDYQTRYYFQPLNLNKYTEVAI